LLLAEPPQNLMPMAAVHLITMVVGRELPVAVAAAVERGEKLLSNAREAQEAAVERGERGCCSMTITRGSCCYETEAVARGCCTGECRMWTQPLLLMKQY
jgi:hypothetical protein